MEAELVWTAAGTVAGCAGLGITWLQVRSQGREQARRPDRTVALGMPVTPPVGGLPAAVHGRDEMLSKLWRLARSPLGAVVVLAGLGGVGKSTVAAALAARAMSAQRGKRRRWVWWVEAADPASLNAGLLTVARQLGASQWDLEAVALGAADAPDRVWRLLDRAPKRWLLVFDNVDAPEVLAVRNARASASVVQDGTGWIRPSRRGLTVVTTRDADPQVWGRYAHIWAVDPLSELESALVLRDLAPRSGDEAQARLLGRRLGGLPLALHLAGTYLDSDVARWPTFSAYGRALDDGEGSYLLDGPDARSAVMRTWEISLDGLAMRGIPHARPLLRLVSCYASNTPIAVELLEARPVLDLLIHSAGPGDSDSTPRRPVDQALRGLHRLGLIESRTLRPESTAIAVHPMVSDTNRAHLSRDEAGAAEVRHAAVDLLAAALERLQSDRPADWPQYRLLARHLLALFEVVAEHVDIDHLVALMESTSATGEALHCAGDVQAGYALLHTALTRSVSLGNDHPSILRARHHLAWNVANRGDLAGAEALYRQIHNSRRRILGSDHPETLATEHELAWISACQDRWAEAEARYWRVLGKSLRVLGADDARTLITRHEIAWVIASQGRLVEAHQALQGVLRDRLRLLGPSHRRTLATRHEIGWVTARQGRWAEAETIYREVFDIRRRVLGAEHPETLLTRHELAWVTSSQGFWAEAEAIYKEVFEIRRRTLGNDHPETVATRTALGELRNGRIVDARHFV